MEIRPEIGAVPRLAHDWFRFVIGLFSCHFRLFRGQSATGSASRAFPGRLHQPQGVKSPVRRFPSAVFGAGRKFGVAAVGENLFLARHCCMKFPGEISVARTCGSGFCSELLECRQFTTDSHSETSNAGRGICFVSGHSRFLAWLGMTSIGLVRRTGNCFRTKPSRMIIPQFPGPSDPQNRSWSGLAEIGRDSGMIAARTAFLAD